MLCIIWWRTQLKHHRYYVSCEYHSANIEHPDVAFDQRKRSTSLTWKSNQPICIQVLKGSLIDINTPFGPHPADKGMSSSSKVIDLPTPSLLPSSPTSPLPPSPTPEHTPTGSPLLFSEPTSLCSGESTSQWGETTCPRFLHCVPVLAKMKTKEHFN